MKKLLVTGGAGFIGSNFIHYWLKKYPKDKIVNLDLLTYAGNLDSLKGLEKNSNYTFIKGDICDTPAVNKAIKGCNVVVHFAAESHVDRSVAGPSEFIRTNVLGTQVLLEAAKENKVEKFHHVSTDEVFGQLELDSKEKFNEQTIYDPRSPYSASKAASDHIVRAYFHTFDLPITITNCANNYGPYHNPEKMIPRFITNLIDDEKVPVYGDGLYVRDWLYVEDHCEAIDLAINKGKAGETYMVGGQRDHEVNNLELTKMILTAMGKDESYIHYVKDRPGHDRRYVTDWSKIENELGYKPKYKIDQWLDVTIKWYQDNEWWWRPLKTESERFYKRLGYGI